MTAVSPCARMPCAPCLPRASHSVRPVQPTPLEGAQRRQSLSSCFSCCPSTRFPCSASPMNSVRIIFLFKLLTTSSIFSIIASVQLLYFKNSFNISFLNHKNLLSLSRESFLSWLCIRSPLLSYLTLSWSSSFASSPQVSTAQAATQPADPGSSLTAVTLPHLCTNDLHATCLALVCRVPFTNKGWAPATCIALF